MNLLITAAAVAHLVDAANQLTPFALIVLCVIFMMAVIWRLLPQTEVHRQKSDTPKRRNRSPRTKRSRR
ncbi:hypothetical protein [Archangium primigenium]|uniref:hypothetical protein n=1 Tax=[Archangium] primigenium TaxID=2792470 RepID=UPI001956953A|nr:hypothetical protein [Archangium primigenium]MBM7112529.1 hypothetical protein [Archangium primigenium]